MAEPEIGVEAGDRFKPNLRPLNSTSAPPPIFDGTSRLYISLTCPYSQRVWIARNFKGLMGIELVPIDIVDKPQWYMRKISAAMKIPALEHEGRIRVESLEILQCLDERFDAGPQLYPQSSPKREAANELLRNAELMNQRVSAALRQMTNDRAFDAEAVDKAVGPLFDQLELALARFGIEGPHLLGGSISLVDFVYVPFVERFRILFQELLSYDVLEGRPRLSRWFTALNELPAYTSTRADPESIIRDMRKSLLLRCRGCDDR